MGTVRIGVSGWSYESWRGSFYPDSLRRSEELSYAARRFDTIEVNGTFYALSTPTTFRRWAAAVPPRFVLSVKGSRFITHVKKLADVGTALSNFLASGLLELGTKLGPILWQLSPQLRFDPERVDTFLGMLPRDTGAAATLACRHDDRVEQVSFGSGVTHRMRHVLEVRHESFLSDEMVRIARRHGVALAMSHSSRWPYTEEITAGFVYLRLHGPDEPYASPYDDDELARWADRIRRWRGAAQPDDARRITDRDPPRRVERDVYVYFDNDAGGHAPRQALRLRELVGPG